MKYFSRLHSKRGYVFILICVCIPLILLGAKLVVDYSSQHTMSLKSFYKRCGNAAALEVAKKWNPGLSLSYQKESMLRIADDVYNRSPAHNDGHAMWEAIPGLDMELPTGMRQRGIYNPLEPTGTKIISMSPSVRTVPYQDKQLKWGRVEYSNVHATVGELYRRIYFLKKNPNILLKEAVQDFIPVFEYNYNNNIYSFCDVYMGRDVKEHVEMKVLATTFSTSARINDTYTTRVNPSDNRVELAIENDRIKVSTDGHPGYAIPAECNVDIVLAIPTNMAACNKDNRDANTTTNGVPTIITTNTVTILDPATLAARTDVQNFRATPIYQIAQGLRRFLDENFKYTRGVNVGLIPYSGKLSIPPEKGDLWTEKFPSFNDSDASLNYIRSCFLYGTVGSKNTSFTTQYSAWGGYNCPERHGGYGIMMRGPLVPSANYGGNRYCVGDLLSTDDPATGNRFYRYNYRPCYGGYANLLSGKCEVNCTEYFYNPYFVVELTADVTKIYDLLNVFVPFNDQRNNSNFLFLPFVWANNLFQDWTKDPGCDAQDSSGSDDGRLSCPSKKQADRKRAMILIVNKPDWFEPNELTYLGFDNDFSEIPMIESDCIRFDVNYSDTSRKFADGSSYNGSICGAKKILYYTTTSGTVRRNSDSGYYETSGSATGRLTFPKKHLIKIVVEPVMVWEKKSCNMGALFGGYWYNMGRVAIAPYNGKNILFAHNHYDQVACSADGVTWLGLVEGRGHSVWNLGPVYGDNGLVIVTKASRSMGREVQQYSADYKTYSSMTSSEVNSNNSFTLGNNIFMLINNYKSVYTAYHWNQWSKAGTFPQEYARVLCYAAGKWIAGSGNMYESYDNGKTWHFLDSSLGNIYGGTSSNEWYGAAYYRNYFYVVHADSKKIARSANGKKWQCIADLGCNTRHRNITNYNDKLYCFGEDGACCHVGSFNNSSIRFNISGMTNGVGSSTYTINDRKEFFIEPSQLTSNQLTFDMKNIRLISAEITNRPYTKVKPECRLSTGGNTAYITTNVRKPVRVKVDAKTMGSIRFYDDNKIEDNVGEHTITSAKTFVFRGGQDPSGTESDVTSTRGVNFGHNLSKYKVRFTTSNAFVKSAILNSQYLRDYTGCYGLRNADYKVLILHDGTLGKRSAEYCYSLAATFGSFYEGNFYINQKSNARENYTKFSDSCVVLSDKDYYIYSPMKWTFPGNGSNLLVVNWKIYGLSSGCLYGCIRRITVFSCGFGEGRHNGILVVPSSYYHWVKSNVDIEISNFSGNLEVSYVYPNRSNLTQMYVKNDLSKQLLSTTLDTNGTHDTAIQQNKGIALQRLSSNLSTQIVAGDYICFQGDGELSVTVEPRKMGTLSINTADGTKRTLTITADQDLVISPDEYLFEQQSDGTYRVSLGLSNVSVSNPTMLDTDYTCVYAKPRLPEMSATVDFSRNNGGRPAYDSNLIVFGENESGSMASTGVKYNVSHGYWNTYLSPGKQTGDNVVFNGLSGWNHHYRRFTGEFYTMVDSVGDGTPQMLVLNKYHSLSNHQAKVDDAFYFGGIFRGYYGGGDVRNCGEYDGYDIVGNYGILDIYNLNSGAVCDFIMTGYTLPINTALHEAGYYGDTCDSMTALQKLTLDACSKLKESCGENLRIYLIRYRKQTQYKFLGKTMSYSYDYLNSCTNNIYDVSTEADLASKLKDIAEDIKNWAGYEPAKNVE